MSASLIDKKPLIGITCGDINGIGPEIIIKALSDSRITDFCTPVVFANNKVINFYRKSIPDCNFNFTMIKDFERPNPKQANLVNCWEEEVIINPGELTDAGGAYAIKSLLAASAALRDGHINAMVTAPIHKKNVQSEAFPYTGHTPFIKSFFKAQDVLMFMVSGGMKVGLATEHLPVRDIASQLDNALILSKLTIMHNSLIRDFNIDKPKIAVLALNPHAGDHGLIGTEEEIIIEPAIKSAKQKNMLVMGPYPADAFFARGLQHRFDGVLAMYHDQGLIPFKSLALEEGVNFTAGAGIVRTSPDHGTAFDIAGKNNGDAASLLTAIFTAVDIITNERRYDENHANPLKKLGEQLIRNSVDEQISENH